MLLLTNTVSGRRLFHKQPPEFCIECHTATILDGRTEFLGRVSSNTIRREQPPGELNPYEKRKTVGGFSPSFVHLLSSPQHQIQSRKQPSVCKDRRESRDALIVHPLIYFLDSASLMIASVSFSIAALDSLRSFLISSMSFSIVSAILPYFVSSMAKFCCV